MRAFTLLDQMMFRIKVSTTKTSAKIGVSLASLASQVLALPFDRKLSAPPEMAPEEVHRSRCASAKQSIAASMLEHASFQLFGLYA